MTTTFSKGARVRSRQDRATGTVLDTNQEFPGAPVHYLVRWDDHGPTWHAPQSLDESAPAPAPEPTTEEIVSVADLSVPTRVGQHLARIRKEYGMTQTCFAKRLGLSRNQLCYLETGKRDMLLSDFAEVCIRLKISPNELLELDT